MTGLGLCTQCLTQLTTDDIGETCTPCYTEWIAYVREQNEGWQDRGGDDA